MSEESEGERQQEFEETRTYYSDRRRRAYIGREILKIYWKPINLTNKLFRTSFETNFEELRTFRLSILFYLHQRIKNY